VGHLTDRFGKHTDLKAGELCWLTDRTPHMPLPASLKTHRQFFRVVTEGVNVWYAKHRCQRVVCQTHTHTHVCVCVCMCVCVCVCVCVLYVYLSFLSICLSTHSIYL
jgi:hypothetical protein